MKTFTPVINNKMKYKIIIKELEKKDLQVLEKAIPFGNLVNPHLKRFKEQEKGNAKYLIAWLLEKPIGHIFLRLDGTKDKLIKKEIGRCAHIEAAAVKPNLRSRGIGTKLVRKCESLSRKKGFKKIGMAVGINNLRASKLYKKLGYKESGLGKFKTGWFVKDKRGKRKKEYEICVYLVKRLY